MFVLGAGNTDVDQLGAGGVEQRLGLGNVGFGADTASQPAPGQVKRVLQILNVFLVKLLLQVEASELEVILGHFGFEGQLHIRHIGVAGLRVCSLDGAADLTPEIGLPAGLPFELEVVVIADRGSSIADDERAMRRDFLMADRRTGRERWRKSRARLANLFAGGEIRLIGLVKALVDCGDAFLELVELGIVVNLPPFSLEHAVGRRCRLPAAAGGWRRRGNGDVRCASFLVDGRSGVGGALVVGAHGLAAG